MVAAVVALVVASVVAVLAALVVVLVEVCRGGGRLVVEVGPLLVHPRQLLI